MPRPAPVTLRQSQRHLEAEVGFLTYVFGGGVTQTNDAREPAKPYDPITPIRSASCRGQLRFWWRATIGARMPSLEAMRDREAKIWGAIWDGAPQHGAVSLVVDYQGPDPTRKPVFSWRDGRNFPDTIQEMKSIEYGAFPLRPTNNPGQEGADPRSSLWDYGDHTFKLVLAFPEEFEQDVVLALSAWLTFGGYGSRLNRGFGAVKLNAEHKSLVDHPDAIFALLKAHPQANAPLLPKVPALSLDPKRLYRKAGGQDPKGAWSFVLGRFKEFRQSPGTGRNPGQSANRPGRSRWPEPDEIRRVTRDNAPMHPPVHPVRAFPRADFGMPIIFHFKDRGEPGDTTLQPTKHHDRLPSSLILRPSAKGEAMVLWLEGLEAPERLYLKGASSEVDKTPNAQELGRLSDDQHRLLAPSPIEAFFAYLNR